MAYVEKQQQKLQFRHNLKKGHKEGANMREFFCLLLLAVNLTTVRAQDVKMLSNSSEYELLRVENTGSSDKLGIAVYNSVGGYSTGVLVQATGTAIDAAIYSSDNTYIATGLNAYVEDWDAWSPRAFTGSARGGDYASVSGLQAYAEGGEYSYNIGVYGWASGGYGSFSAAGYFDGDLYGYGPYPPSDQKFKTNIIDFQGGLQKIMALKPKRYNMKTDEFKGKINLPKGNQIGFIAQEVETVLPELVKSAAAPVHLTKEEEKNHVKKEPMQYKALDYTGMIPVMIKAMQEQQALIEALQAEVAALKLSSK